MEYLAAKFIKPAKYLNSQLFQDCDMHEIVDTIKSAFDLETEQRIRNLSTHIGIEVFDIIRDVIGIRFERFSHNRCVPFHVFMEYIDFSTDIGYRWVSQQDGKMCYRDFPSPDSEKELLSIWKEI
jgi:hypothetical protein